MRAMPAERCPRTMSRTRKEQQTMSTFLWILVGLVYTSMLFMVVPLVSALESLDDSLIEAA